MARRAPDEEYRITDSGGGLRMPEPTQEIIYHTYINDLVPVVDTRAAVVNELKPRPNIVDDMSSKVIKVSGQPVTKQPQGKAQPDTIQTSASAKGIVDTIADNLGVSTQTVYIGGGVLALLGLYALSGDK